jgi:hypothetical protein
LAGDSTVLGEQAPRLVTSPYVVQVLDHFVLFAGSDSKYLGRRPMPRRVSVAKSIALKAELSSTSIAPSKSKQDPLSQYPSKKQKAIEQSSRKSC